ncbi:MAG TPA: alpha/beta hydrolase [Gemmatales bacterium]|nr:alpha/beta hydrolase [Gemmatales bacterium]
MFRVLKKLAYGARVLLARSGELSVVDVAGVPTQIRRGGEGPPFFYLHSALGETIWLPFLELWSRKFTVYAPAHPGYAQSQGFDALRHIDDLAFHYVDMLDTLGLDKVAIGGISLGGWTAVEIASRGPERVSKLWLCNAPGLWTIIPCPTYS